MIKLDNICNKLNDIRDKLEAKAEAIEDNAYNRDRDLTEKEEERIDELYAEIDAIDNALDYLKDFCINF